MAWDRQLVRYSQEKEKASDLRLREYGHNNLDSLKADIRADTAPYNLPLHWDTAQDKVKANVPFVFTATSDTIGGNSGSPILNRQNKVK